MKQKVAGEVGLLIYPDCQLSAVYGLTDIFRISADFIEPPSGTEQSVVRVSHWRNDGNGVACVYDSHPGNAHTLTHLIVPPSLVVPERMVPMAVCTEWMMARHAKGVTLCSVCAGAFLLAETGLLKGRKATTHWAFAKQMTERFPDILVEPDRMVIDDGDIITAGGILAWADLGLTLTERLLGPSVMLETARFMLIDPPGRSQQPYSHFVPRMDHGDAAILKVQHWLQATGAKDHSIPALAEIAGLEARTFQRRFKAATEHRPTEYAQQIRISKARESLELTRRPVEQIAWDVGYGDPSAFRKLFQRVTGLAPADYRKRFGVASG